jgi:hypothetical protein
MGSYVSNCSQDCYTCKGPSGSEGSFQTNYSASVQNISDDNTGVSVSYQADLQNDTNASANVQLNYMSKESQDKDAIQMAYNVGEINAKDELDEEKKKIENDFLKHDNLEMNLSQKKEDTNATVNFSVDSTQSDVPIEDILNGAKGKVVDGHSKHGIERKGLGNEIKGFDAITAKFD